MSIFVSLALPSLNFKVSCPDHMIVSSFGLLSFSCFPFIRPWLNPPLHGRTWLEKNTQLTHCYYLKFMSIGFKLAFHAARRSHYFLCSLPSPSFLKDYFIPSPLSASFSTSSPVLTFTDALALYFIGKWKKWGGDCHVLQSSHHSFYLYLEPCMWPVLLLMLVDCLCSYLRTALPLVPYIYVLYLLICCNIPVIETHML